MNGAGDVGCGLVGDAGDLLEVKTMDHGSMQVTTVQLVSVA